MRSTLAAALRRVAPAFALTALPLLGACGDQAGDDTGATALGPGFSDAGTTGGAATATGSPPTTGEVAATTDTGTSATGAGAATGRGVATTGDQPSDCQPPCDTEAPVNDSPASRDGDDSQTLELTCVQFLAHAPEDETRKFEVGVASDAYFGMVFQAPWEGTVYGLVFKPIVDNGEVLQRWQLYQQPGAGPDGQVESTLRARDDAELVHAWAPGGKTLDFREHGSVGLELPSTTYRLELYYDSADPSALDASGVELCYVRDKPEHVAGISWLGVDHGVEQYAVAVEWPTPPDDPCARRVDFAADEWTGTCAPASNQPIQLLLLRPQMGEMGVHMSATILGPGGERVLHDAPFDVHSQGTHATEEVLMPGETITTTCQFSAPTCAGELPGTDMCYLHVYAYPKGVLRDTGPWGALSRGKSACLGQ